MIESAEARGATRLDEFEIEIRKLGVSAGSSPRDRLLMIAGLVLAAIGLIVGFLGLNSVRSATTELQQGDGFAQVVYGVGIAVIGVVVWARYSMTRYLRYWLVRRIHEDRAMTDRVVQSIDRP